MGEFFLVCVHSNCHLNSLRGSLHIQVCSLMAKFICSMRTILDRCDSGSLASMHYIIGRICHLMIVKLDPNVKCFHLLDFSHGSGKSSASSVGKIYVLNFGVRNMLLIALNSFVTDDLRASFEICNVDDCRYVDVQTITGKRCHATIHFGIAF